MSFRIVRNDITKMHTDAIVNTANEQPAVGTGCDHAVYTAAGYKELLAYRKKHIGVVPEGEVFITPGFGLPAKYIIHAVSPLYFNGQHGEEALLRSCYRKSLALAEQNGIRSVAFPLISTGGFGYPKEEGMRIAVDEIHAFLLHSDMQIYLVVFDEKATHMGRSIDPDLEAYIDRNYVEEKREEEYGDAYYAEDALKEERRREDARREEMRRRDARRDNAFGGGKLSAPQAKPVSSRDDARRDGAFGSGKLPAPKARPVSSRDDARRDGAFGSGKLPAPKARPVSSRDEARRDNAFGSEKLPRSQARPVSKPDDAWRDEAPYFGAVDASAFHEDASNLDEDAGFLNKGESTLDEDAAIEEMERRLKERLAHMSDTFPEYLLYLIRTKGMENSEVYKRAIVDKKVFSKIKSNPKYHPQKLTALCLCIGAKLNMDETRDLLARAGYALSPCNKTDIIFSYFIENGIYDMIELDIQLEEHGLPCIIS